MCHLTFGEIWLECPDGEDQETLVIMSFRRGHIQPAGVKLCVTLSYYVILQVLIVSFLV